MDASERGASYWAYFGKRIHLSVLPSLSDPRLPVYSPDQWRIETEPHAGPIRFGFFHGALDARKDELSCGAALSGSGLMEPAVKLERQVDRDTDRTGLHRHRLCAGDLISQCPCFSPGDVRQGLGRKRRRDTATGLEWARRLRQRKRGVHSRRTNHDQKCRARVRV